MENKKKLRIALLHNSLDVRGGAEKQLLNLTRELKSFGHEIKIYVSKLDKEKCYSELMDGLKIIECGGYGYDNIRKQILFSKRYMEKMAEKIEPCDIINCHNFPTTYAAVAAKKRFKVPIVWTCNEPPFPPLYTGIRINYSIKSLIYRILMFKFLLKNKIILKYIDRIIVLDEMNKKRINKTYSRNPEILWTGLDHPNISEKEMNLSQRGKDAEIKIFTVSRLDKQRRVQDLIGLAKILKNKKIPFKIEIGGSGPYEKILKEQAKKVSENIIFLGRLTDKQLTEAYIHSDIVVFTPENQSWGLVPLEAAYFGRPSLVSNGTGIADVFKDGKNARIYEVGNVNNMFKKLSYFLEDRKRISEIGNAARKFVLKTFSWNKYARKMEQIFFEEAKRYSKTKNHKL